MRFSFSRKRKKQPTLVEGQKTAPRQKLETLKAGRLASLAIEITRTLIDTFGPRVAGSDSAQRAAEAIEAAYIPFCNQTAQTEFLLDTDTHSKPFTYACYLYPLLVLLMCIGLPWVSLLLFLVFGWYTARELYLYKPIGRLHRTTSKGINVHGVLEPEGEVQHTLIFSAHHDSAPLHRYNQLDRFSYARNVLLPVVLFLFSGVLSLVQMISELLARILLIPNFPSLPMFILLVLLLGATPLLFPLRTFYEKEGSPGAGDNLVSVGMTIQLARFFHWKKDCGKSLSHTRLIFCSFDGEEAALQGSRAWFSQMASSLIDPLALNFDSVYYSDHLTFLERDINGTQPLDVTLARRCTEIARSMGYEAKSESIPRLWGGTDAAEASRYNIPATTLTAVAWDDRSKPALQHTRDDVVDAVELKALEMALSVAIKLTDMVDEDRLWEETEVSQEEPQDTTSLVFSKLTNR
ncbi:MAG: M28 family peptidase [Sphaerochaetaceae bacterium]